MTFLSVHSPGVNPLDFSKIETWPDRFEIRLGDAKRSMLHPIAMNTIWMAMKDRISKLGYNVSEYRDESLQVDVLLCIKNK